jgi:hypothetical protein
LPFVGDAMAAFGKMMSSGFKVGFGEAREQVVMERSITGALGNIGIPPSPEYANGFVERNYKNIKDPNLEVTKLVALPAPITPPPADNAPPKAETPPPKTAMPDPAGAVVELDASFNDEKFATANAAGIKGFQQKADHTYTIPIDQLGKLDAITNLPGRSGPSWQKDK